MVKQFTCGVGNGPVAGQSIFQAEFLKNCIVNFIIVNNIPENQLNPSPNFKHSYVEGTIDRSPNVWFVSDKLIIDFEPCNNCK
jgi:hypothetical protein